MRYGSSAAATMCFNADCEIINMNTIKLMVLGRQHHLRGV